MVLIFVDHQTAGLLALIDLTVPRLTVLLRAALIHVGAVRAEVHKVRVQCAWLRCVYVR